MVRMILYNHLHGFVKLFESQGMAARKGHIWEKNYPSGVEWNMGLESYPLYRMLDESAEKYPDHICTNYYGKETTYADIQDQVNRLTKGLQRQGIGKGMRVGILMPNCPQYVVAYYAILKLGAVVVNLSPLYTVQELKALIQDVGLDLIFTLNLKILHEKVNNLLVTTSLERAVIVELQDALPFPKSMFFNWFRKNEIAAVQYGRVNIAYSELMDNDGRYREVDINPDEDLAVLQFTGGTTGVAKAAKLTHANLAKNMQQCKAWMSGLEEGQERVMAILPFFHIFALTTILNVGVALGAELVIQSRFDLMAVLKELSKKVTLLPAVPTMLSAITNYSKLHQHNFGALKFCISGGAPLPPELKEVAEKMLGCPVLEGYGLTECSPVLTINPLTGKSKAGSVGLPLPGTIIEICSTEGSKRKKLATKEIGEVVASGPQVMQGYLHSDEDGKKTLKGGKLRTGDLGYMDKEGYVFLVDRIKDVIISAGYNVYPREIEEALYQHNAVEEAAVLAHKDSAKGEVPKAFIKVRLGEEVTEKELQDFLRKKLAKYKIPKLYEFLEDIPKTMVGKVDKKQLKQMLEEELVS